MRRTWIISAAIVASIAAGWGVYERLKPSGRSAGETTAAASSGTASSAASRAGAGASRRLAPPALLSREAEAEAIGRFDAWAAGYLASTDPAARRASLAAGLAAAQARREVLRDLIASDPERALAHAVPWSVRSGLPSEILPLLEDRVDGIGRYSALGAVATHAALDPSAFRASIREVELDGRRYETFTYGRRLALGSHARLAVHGIAIDGRLALLDSPVRVLESGEPVPAGRRVDEVCAVSGQSSPAAAAPAAVDTGDRVVYLCSAGHISVLASRLQSAEEGAVARTGGDDGAETAPADGTVAPAQGARRVVMLRVRFADQPAWFEPETQASAEAMFAATDAFYRENSSGALRIEGTVSPVYTLPQTAAWYAAHDTSGYALNVLLAARAVAADPASSPGNAGLPATNYLEYDFEAVRYTTGPGVFSGQGYVAMRGCWIKVSDAGVLTHELGHNLGLWHANAWNPSDPLVPLGAGANAEYGDQFDTMGPARGGAWHFNTWEKRHLGWLGAADVATISGAGATQALAAHDLGSAPAGGLVRALRVPRDGDRDYWVEFRRHPAWLASRRTVHEGVTLRWDPWSRSNGGTQLIDATPGSPGGRDDATLAVGRTFSDLAAGVHITPVAIDPADPASIAVDVRIGDFASNRRPVVSVSSATVEAVTGQPIAFTASASDPDGDALSYVWSFDDSGATIPGAQVAHAWADEGDHRARVTVSDRRGGTASASVVVRVGAVSGTRITGRVLDLAGQPVPGVLVHNDTEPGADAYRAAWSDADGSFTLLGVPPGTWQLVATAPGWIFAVEGFTRPVTTPDETGDVTIRGVWKGFTVSGSLRRADGTPVAGALVRIGDRVEPTDRFGEFALTGMAPGRHTLATEAAGAVFDPLAIELGQGDVDALYLEEETFTISGTLRGSASGAVTVTTGWQSAAVSTGTDASAPARFSIAGVPAGTWSVRAVAPAASYSPDGFTPPVEVASDVSGLALAGDAALQFAIGGVVRDRGVGVAGATVTASGLSVVTDSRGGYWLSGLAPGHHEVSVAAPGLSFSPATRAVDIAASHVIGIDFASDRVNQLPVLVASPRAVGPVDQPFIKLAVEATDDDSAGLLRYWWSVIGDAPGEVAFSANGANAAREVIARFSTPGSYLVRVTAVDRFGAEQSGDVLLTVGGDSGPPVLIEAARAEPAVVGATLETVLSVRASSNLADGRIVYTWSADVGAAGPVTFSANGSPSARECTARFRAPGNYLLRVTARDSAGRSVESSVSVRVELTFVSWLAGWFEPAVVADPSLRASVWGEYADPDGDGLANLLEYAFGGDPLSASPDARPRTHFVTEGGVEYLAVTFRPNPSAIDLVFEPQLSSDLETWQTGAVFVPGPDERLLTYRDFSPASDHPRRFIRINVSQPLR